MDYPNELTAEGLWNDVSARLRGALNEQTFRTYFGEVAAVRLDDETFVLSVPNDFTRDWIKNRFAELIRAGIKDVSGVERRVEFAIEAPPPAPVTVPTIAPPRHDGGTIINPKYTFDSFVIGSSNRFAHAAALAIAEAPGQAYNPLFIYGHTGLGKTHLLHAVANYIGRHSSELTVRYVTSETFMNDFINSLRDKRIEGFKQRYRAYDVLLIDDVQFFEHKERIQEEFFHTFNSLHEAGRQIVMSSDRAPRDIQTLEDRLRSRFEWGLTTDIQPPDLETRIAILRRKVKYDGIDVGDEEVLTHIASRVTT
ncbi:MAG TPA: chromosomal replication initiator protein DnaA, partial [Gaiellaceae bacterium]